MWSPESGNELLSASVDVLRTEETSFKLWAEYLAGYFDGAEHGTGPRVMITADSASDVLFADGHGLENDQSILIYSIGGTIPDPLELSENYYVVNTALDEFQISDVVDGDPIDLLDEGSGLLYVRKGTLFPVASLIFQQHATPQPLEGLSFHLVSVFNNKTKTKWKAAQESGMDAFNKTLWTFFIRAAVNTPRPDGHTSESLVRIGADLLYGLLMQKELTMPLNRKGIKMLRPQPPKLETSTDYALRSMPCSGTLHFAVDSD